MPLAAVLRPNKLDDIIGQAHLLGPTNVIRRMAVKRQAHSTIIWGPPGTGKTTLVKALSKEIDASFFPVNATNATVKDLREIINAAKTANNPPFVFVDECLSYNTLIYCLIDGIIVSKPIGEIVEKKLDVLVLSFNHWLNKCELKPIISYSTTKPKIIVEIVIEDDGFEFYLRCSADHLIYTENRGYVAAQDLVVSDKVMRLSKDSAQEIHNVTKSLQNMQQSV